jgi:DNA polymerase V
MYGLIDCNNFYASCERVFNPALRNRPIIVLSNNDGGVIARSKRPSAGYQDGGTLFQVKDIVKNNWSVYISSITHFRNMSHRYEPNTKCMPHIDFYSIDECFVGLSGSQ